MKTTDGFEAGGKLRYGSMDELAGGSLRYGEVAEASVAGKELKQLVGDGVASVATCCWVMFTDRRE